MIGSDRIAVRSWAVDIQHAVVIEGPSGAPVTVWQLLMPAYMAREAMLGDERLMAGTLSARQYTRWTMVFEPLMDPDTIDVPAKRRLVFEGREYDIVRARPVGPLGSLIELVTLVASKVASQTDMVAP